MFIFNRKSLINPQLSYYIKEKNLDFQNKLKEKYVFNNEHLKAPYLAKQSNEENKLHNCVLLLPVVSFISFFIGYSFCKSIS